MPIPDEDVSSTLRTILARELKRAPETLAPEANLAELGLSSVKVLRAVAEDRKSVV
jgi:aryl carrier-like protein